MLLLALSQAPAVIVHSHASLKTTVHVRTSSLGTRRAEPAERPRSILLAKFIKCISTDTSAQGKLAEKGWRLKGQILQIIVEGSNIEHQQNMKRPVWKRRLKAFFFHRVFLATGYKTTVSLWETWFQWFWIRDVKKSNCYRPRSQWHLIGPAKQIRIFNPLFTTSC